MDYEIWRKNIPTGLFFPASIAVLGALDVGIILQVLQNTYTTNTNLTAQIPSDDTTPLSSEGTQVLSQAITPTDNTNKVLCRVSLWGADNSAGAASIAGIVGALFRGTTCIQAVFGQASDIDSGGGYATAFGSVNFEFYDSPATASSVTYTVRVGPNISGDTIRLNGSAGSRIFGGTSACTLTLMEVMV